MEKTILVKIIVQDGRYRIYKCPYDGPTPQGDRVTRNEEELLDALFPNIEAEPDRL
ncbi:MAG TPA: hypothetical protein PKD55_01500 [Bellilinea sp.]|nr:hypothetical protein [Bellilinea sp.]